MLDRVYEKEERDGNQVWKGCEKDRTAKMRKEEIGS